MIPDSTTSIEDSTRAVIELANVSVASRLDVNQELISDIEWTVLQGELWVIAGLQGSGKSDLMSLLAGLTAPLSGNYQLLGGQMPIEDEEALPQRLKMSAVIEQQAGLLHQLTVRENVALPLSYHRKDSDFDVERKTQEMLDMTGLAGHSENFPGRLSRAWRTRAVLARALIMEPEVVLFDVPLAGLDPRNAAWWLEFIQKLHRGEVFKGKPMSLVVTVDDLRPWRSMNCEFALLKEGRFLKLGRQPRWSDHAEPLVRELMAEHPAETGDASDPTK